ncbi:MAG: hypothetical protein NT013_09580 [Planctomycetia bacterium]|nr:hypothetical protein [Planctomycetia bacterium]
MVPFNIHQSVCNEDGENDEVLAERYADALCEQFADSPEGRPLSEAGVSLQWPHLMMHYSVGHLGLTPPQMSVRDFEEVLFEIIPRKVSADADEADEIVTVLQVFWQYLQREFRLPNANGILQRLGTGATQRLHDALDDPSNFGMAKSFFTAGAKAGFDMMTEAGMNAFMLAYNARILANRSAGQSTLPQETPRRFNIFGDDDSAMPFGNRTERRTAEREKLRLDKKRQRQAKRKNRR